MTRIHPVVPGTWLGFTVGSEIDGQQFAGELAVEYDCQVEVRPHEDGWAVYAR